VREDAAAKGAAVRAVTSNSGISTAAANDGTCAALSGHQDKVQISSIGCGWDVGGAIPSPYHTSNNNYDAAGAVSTCCLIWNDAAAFPTGVRRSCGKKRV
jgi:hypothetical protein